MLDLAFWKFSFFSSASFCSFVCCCCVRFSFFSTKPRDWLGRTSL